MSWIYVVDEGIAASATFLTFPFGAPTAGAVSLFRLAMIVVCCGGCELLLALPPVCSRLSK